ncbi:MAG: hypothetical protein ACQEXX_00450 [Bacillota bacterium]
MISKHLNQPQVNNRAVEVLVITTQQPSLQRDEAAVNVILN